MSQMAIDAATECEIKVLGAVVTGQCSPPPKAVKQLKPEQFSSPVRRAAWEAVAELWAQGRNPDEAAILGVWAGRSDQLPKAATAELYSYSDHVFTAENADIHAREVANRAYIRSMVEGLKSISGSIDYGMSQNEVAERVGAAAALAMHSASTATRASNELLLDHSKLVQERWDTRHEAKGVRTGIKALDEAIHGLLPGKMYVIAARPGMGKTGLALDMLRGVTRNGGRGIMFSLEMDAEELCDRLVAAEARVDSNRLMTGHLRESDFIKTTAAYGRLSVGDRLKVNDAVHSWRGVASECRAAAHDGLDVVFIDYLQLLGGEDRHNREREVAEISRGAKMMSKELGCAVVILAQLNRECEKRPDKRPLLSDLRESGAIEQDADGVIMIYRDWVYNDTGDMSRPGENDAEVLIRKLRYGKSGNVALTWEGQFTSFRDPS